LPRKVVNQVQTLRAGSFFRGLINQHGLTA
jgi:hypothetical protein